ncbi:MAG: energy-coupling factor ABC transporter permease [Actinomycetota bacterium]|jgi:cobalt/nickel transport system permease protein|nr:energy-coupling factor ABC transporter permease [Actinomycetota bacterium]MDQ3382279.1 energy-coupling factor ABC transporter permease [Actinomycetota bacterium]MDQ3526438.1 energy-coupling factor ABC transporter permease [Actinomycetota bacterium]
MHVPDGFLDLATSIGTGAVAAAGVGLALRGARRELDDRTAPLAGLTAVFIFAGQMVNFPVGAGTSGHLLGGALAALLVGPWTATLCLSVVLIVQALLFADGGLTALGTNITLLGLVAVWAAWFVFKGLSVVLPRRRAVIPPLAFVAGLVSVPVAALAFVGLFAIGGLAPVPLDTLTTAMLGWHTAIGLGEGLVTALVVSSVLAVRPDLVHAARGYQPAQDLLIRDGVRA